MTQHDQNIARSGARCRMPATRMSNLAGRPTFMWRMLPDQQQHDFCNDSSLAGHVIVDDFAILAARWFPVLQIGSHVITAVGSVVLRCTAFVTASGTLAPHSLNSEAEAQGLSTETLLQLRSLQDTVQVSLTLEEASRVGEQASSCPRYGATGSEYDHRASFVNSTTG